MAKPNIEDTRWAVTALGVESSAISDPDGTLKDEGYPLDAIPDSKDWNFWHLKAFRWFQYLNAQVFEGPLTIAGAFTVGGQPLSVPIFVFTADSGTDQLTKTAHGLETGDGALQVSNVGGALPTPLVAATNYFAIVTGANTFKIATSRANALINSWIDLTTGGSGTNSIVGVGATRSSDEHVTRDLMVDGNATVSCDLVVGGAFSHRGVEFLPLGPGMASNGNSTPMNYQASDDRLIKINDTTALELGYPIPLPRGRRIVGVRVHVMHTSATAGLWQAVLLRSDMANTTTSRSTAVSSAASAAKQTIVLTGITPTAIGADESWSVYVSSPGGPLCDRYSFGVEIEHDGQP